MFVCPFSYVRRLSLFLSLSVSIPVCLSVSIPVSQCVMLAVLELIETHLPLSPECCDSCPSCYGFCFFSHFSTQLSFGSLYLLSLGAFLGLIHPMKMRFCWLSRICSLFLFDIFFLLTFPICPHIPSLSTRVVCLPAQCLS